MSEKVTGAKLHGQSVDKENEGGPETQRAQTRDVVPRVPQRSHEGFEDFLHQVRREDFQTGRTGETYLEIL